MHQQQRMRINRVSNRRAYVMVEHEGGERVIDVPPSFFARGVPRPGDYLVRSGPDGDLDWMPKASAEAEHHVNLTY